MNRSMTKMYYRVCESPTSYMIYMKLKHPPTLKDFDYLRA